MKTRREDEFTIELFELLKDRIEGEGIASNDALAAAMQVEPHVSGGYVAAIRENRPWCIGTSLHLASVLGWDIGVGFTAETVQ